MKNTIILLFLTLSPSLLAAQKWSYKASFSLNHVSHYTINRELFTNGVTTVPMSPRVGFDLGLSVERHFSKLLSADMQVGYMLGGGSTPSVSTSVKPGTLSTLHQYYSVLSLNLYTRKKIVLSAGLMGLLIDKDRDSWVKSNNLGYQLKVGYQLKRWAVFLKYNDFFTPYIETRNTGIYNRNIGVGCNFQLNKMK
jgi:hypothetical protein